MQVIDYELKRKNESVYCIGDTHEDSILQVSSKLNKVIKKIKEEEAPWLHMGDWINGIMTNDPKYYEGHNKCTLPREQEKHAVKRFEGIGKQGIVGLQGNHDRWLHRYGDIAQNICDAIAMPYGTFSSHITFRYKGKVCFRLFVHHSLWQFNTNAKSMKQQEGNIQESIKMKLREKVGDCAVMLCANAHLLKVIDPDNRLYLYVQGTKLQENYTQDRKIDYTARYIHPDDRWYGCTGSFEKLYGDGISAYAEFAGCNPRELGYIKLNIVDGKPFNLEAVTV